MFEPERLNRPTEFEPENAPRKNLDRPIEIAAPEATSDPTRETYLGWSDAYDFFNVTLFSDELPPCLITYQRLRKSYGYYVADRFVPADMKSCLNSSTVRIDEIAINPAYLHALPDEHALSTLVHEMAHLKRFRLIKPRPTPGYHDKKWANIMIDVGLMPSTTCKPGGKTTGQRVSDYIIPGGRFETAAQELRRRGFSIRYVERQQSAAPAGGAEAGNEDDGLARRRARSAASKTRYSCVNCKPMQRAWAKPGAHFICGNCNTPMLPLSGGPK